MKSAPTIAFDYRPSPRIGVAAALLCVGAGVAIGVSGLPLLARIALVVLALAFGAQALRAYFKPRFQRIAWRVSGWCLVDAAGEEHAAVLHAHRRVGRWLALDFRHARRARFRVLLTPDNLDADSRRRLILMLARADVAPVT